MRYLSTTIMLLCCVFEIAAQEFRSDRLPTQEQLPVANVHRVFQDMEGYMWYATEGGGLCRDNGYKVDVIRSDRNHPDILASNDITCISESADGKIWFGTPSEFIRSQRLESAAQMLLTTSLSVSEVSDRTGFGTPRYFSRCFRKKYGMLPKDFRKQGEGSENS